MGRLSGKVLAIAVIKAIVAIVVLWAVGRHVARTWKDIRSQGVAIHCEPGWLVGSGLFYIAGLAACGRFYERILFDSATPVRLRPALRAYLISHLGKYVPGKAMVVVVRAGLVVPYGARASTAAFATFYETLVMMAAGGLIAAAGFAVAPGSHDIAFGLPGWGSVRAPVYVLAAFAGLGLGLGFLVLVLPPVFSRLARMVSLPVPGVGPDALPRLSGRLLVRGLLWSSAGWILLGISQWAVVRAFDGAGAERLLALGLGTVVVAAVALATLIGFVVAVLPGGLGVREGVLMSVLAPALGDGASVIAALVLRLVWVVAELAVGAMLFAWPPHPIATLDPPGKIGQRAP
jgi:uncharacterized membrane protein YbhN (UPF0104 family)